MSSFSTLASVLPSIRRHVLPLSVILICVSGALRSGTPSVSAAEADTVVPLPAPVEPKVEPAPVPVPTSAPLPRADLPAPVRPGAPAPGAPTAANAEGSPLILDEILVTATRRDEKTFDLPYSTQVLDGDTLNAQKAFRTLPESLREVPGVMIQKTSVGQGSPYIRGFTGYRTLLLIDGVRLNNAVFREGPNQYWNTVDNLTVDRLEIVKGPSSVLYGSDAIGGTVNVLTRSRMPGSPGGYLLDPWRTEGRVFYRYATAEQSNTIRGEGSWADAQSIGVLGGVSFKDFGDTISGRHLGTLPYTSYDELDGDVKAVWQLEPGLELVGAFQQVTQNDVPRTHATIYAQSFHGSTVGTDLRREFNQDRTLGYVQLHWDKPAEWLSRLNASLSYQEQDEEEDRIQSSRKRTFQSTDDGTLGSWIQLESPSPIGTLVYGVEYYHDFVGSASTTYNTDGTSVRAPRGPVADDASYDQLGVYIQDEIRPWEPVEFIVGGRYNYVHARANKVDPNTSTLPDFGALSDDYQAFVGSARAVVHPLDEGNFFGGVSQGFRAPNLSDLTRFDIARSGELETPSPDLEPEKFLSLEAGTKWRLLDGKAEAYASYYYTFIDGMIQRYPTGRIVEGLVEVQKANIGDGYVQGVEVGGSWNFWQGFTAFGSFAWLEGEAETYVGDVKEDDPLSRIQPATALLGLRWDSTDRKVFVEGTVLLVRAQERLSIGDVADTQRIPPGGTPGYSVATLRAGVVPVPGLQLFAAVENITDKDYRVHGSGQDEPGTNVILGADWRF